MNLKHLILLVFLGISSCAIAQETDMELAEYYYNQGMFEQAKLYYEKIYKTNKTAKVFNNYLNSLIELREFEEAEKMAKKKIKDDGKDGVGYVKLGELYTKFDKPDEARAQFEEAIKRVEPTRSNIQRLANEFSMINQFEFALQVYEKGRTQSKDGYNFTYEVANMKGNLGDHAGMTEAFLDLIAEEPHYMQTVQNSFNRLLNLDENKENVDMLKTALLRRAQKTPEQTIYAEMLVWLFMQKKDFAGAFVQASALDKRLNEDGSRMMNLARLASNSDDFSTAKKAYQYVVEKGPASSFYILARIEKLQVMQQEVSKLPGADTLYVQLDKDYDAALNEIGRNAETAILMKELAHIRAFHLYKTTDAIALLQEAVDLPGLQPKVQAVCKLELGDVHVFEGNVWEASLLFSQVELDFKDDILGNDAKFRNARISYFTGDFEWAQGQLDALKASTSKLISNDAIDLSLLITDNFNMDTTTAPMMMYARADLLAYQNRYDECMLTLDSILTEYPSHTLSDEIKMLKAGIYMKQGKYDLAKQLYQNIIDLHFADITADDALFKLAEMHEYIYHDNAQAMALYEKLIAEFPGSLFVVEARKHFRALRGDELN
ncbi:MAG: tetratricopeptide repeat protein [Flavobacteriales bacterium]|jgi:tetratricopeptide (TPR) repeat protein